MFRHLGLLAVCACVGVSVGCDGGKMTGPAPPPPSPNPTPTAIATVIVEFGGRVVNADVGGPVANVQVSVSAWASPSERTYPFRDALFKEIATSGGDGTFTLPLTLPSDWKLVYLKFTGPAGFEDGNERFEPTATPFCHIAPCWAAADRPAIRIYPTLVIRPGESVGVRVQGDMPWCGWAGEVGPCRRVQVAASPGDPVELEIVPDDSGKPMALSLEEWSFEPDMRRLMVPPGGFPYVFGAGTARLTARR